MTRQQEKPRMQEKNFAEEEKEEEEQEEEEEEDEEEEEEDDDDEQQPLQELTQYEIQRQQRISQNAAKLAALNLPSLASTFQNPLQRCKQQTPSASTRRSARLKTPSAKGDKHRDDEAEGDDDYRPSDTGSDSEAEDSGDDEGRPRVSGVRQPESSLLAKDVNSDGDEDIALQKALALSLGASMEDIVGANGETSRLNLEQSDGGEKTKNNITEADKNCRVNKDKRASSVSGSSTMRKRQKKGWKELLEFTDDEIFLFFSMFDERGKGKFSVLELERVAYSHDFTWSKQDIFDMIDVFDHNKDGQLDLTEFRSMVALGNMMKSS